MSLPPKILELIHASIDGVATEAEQATLHDAIARDPAVRDEYRRLVGLAELLGQVGPEAPPAQLVPSVMRELRRRGDDTRVGFAGRIRALWPGRHLAVRYAYALAAGVVIGILGLQLASGGGIFGTAVSERDAGATIGAAAHADRLDLAPAGVKGIATLRPTPTGTAIGIDLGAAEPVEFVLRYDPVDKGGRVRVVVVREGGAIEVGTLSLPERH